MTTQFLIALLINLALLLLISWIAAAYIITALVKEKKALLQRQGEEKPPEDKQPSPNMSNLLEEMAKEIREKEARIQSLMAIDNNQQQTRFMLSEFGGDDNEAFDFQLKQMDNNSSETQALIQSLQKDLEASQYALGSMEQQLNDGQGQAARIAALEKSQRRLRDENHKLRLQSSEYEQEAIHSKNLKTENVRLKKTLKSLATASNEQLATIRKLQKEIDRATQLEHYQKSLIDDLEQKLITENQQENVDSEQVKAMESELEELKDTLKRTLVEKQFIEDHLLEMDDSLEKARETEQALRKAKEEIAQLEQKFPEYTPEQSNDKIAEEDKLARSDPIQTPPAFESDNPELNAIVSDNRLYGALQEFWTSLDTPPLNLVETYNINPPPFNDWVEVTIGNHDFQVVMAVNDDLAKIIANAIFDEPSDEEEGEKKDAIGELCNIVAGTLATELDNNYPVSIPKHIDYTDAYAQQQEGTLVSEILTLSQDKPLYAVMLIPPENKKNGE